jgi:hypothetical protein
MLLVIYQDNWSDEIYVAGSKLFKPEDWMELVDLAEGYFENEDSVLCNNIGGNATIEYNSFEEWLSCYTTIELTEVQAVVIKQLIEDNYTYEFASEKQFYYPIKEVYPED